jgi:hypothetical protein
MAELLRFIATQLMFLFDEGRYRIVDSRSGKPAGDGLVVVESEAVRLRFVRDRSRLSADIQPCVDGVDDWFGIGVARRWILGERPGYDHLDESSVAFLRDHLGRIETEWSTSSGRETGLHRMRAERSARADELFGKPPR